MDSKKKLALLSVCSICALATFNSFADGTDKLQERNTSYYLGTNVSQSFNTSSKELSKKDGFKSNTPNGDVFIGKEINKKIRLELSAGYRNFKHSNLYPISGDMTVNEKYKLSTFNVMLNSYYNMMPINDTFTPYVMAGIGTTHVNKSNFLIDTSETSSGNPLDSNVVSTKKRFNIAYQLGIGFDIKLNNNLSLDIGVRHANYGKIKTNDNELVTPLKLKSNEGIVGVRYHF
ncbi:MAG: porin family protein [Alphaproteobacteria bacterium]|nr:porin family protein [Alphaproteobacteria bacterium]